MYGLMKYYRIEAIWHTLGEVKHKALLESQSTDNKIPHPDMNWM